jgi:copper resistance protein D
LIWLLRDIDLLVTLLRAANLSFEALLLGGILYLLAVARPAKSSAQVEFVCFRGIRWSALALALAELVTVVLSSASLLGDSDQHFRDLLTTNFFLAGLSASLLATLVWFSARVKSVVAMIPLSLLLLAATVSTSHAAARMDHRWSLAFATAAHHLATAAWIGAMPFLLVSLGRVERVEEAQAMARRYSRMALLSVPILVLAGVYMAWFYVGTWNGLYGTSYGVLLLAKIYLLLVMILMGAGNWLVVRRLSTSPQPLLARLRRFAEAEIGLGFTVILAAASMSSQPPAVDLPDQVSLQAIAARVHPEVPRMKSPAASQLTPPTSIETAVHEAEFKPMGDSDAMDREWSEYNHHWAGLIVLLAGMLALLSRVPGMRWARFWPLSFAGLSVFIVLRADPESWPIGPRPFWASFSAPDVLAHRVAALLILCFAAFECAVQAGKLRARWAVMIFPAMCALGAAVLLTHNHAASDNQEDLLASLSHTLIALLGATAGWARWLELRLPPGRASRIAGYLWPLFLSAAGLVLLNYREI